MTQGKMEEGEERVGNNGVEARCEADSREEEIAIGGWK